MTVEIPKWAIRAAGIAALVIVGFLVGRGCSNESQEGRMPTPGGSSPSSHVADGASDALPCTKSAARKAVDLAIRDHGPDSAGLLLNETTGGLRRGVFLNVVSCEDLTGDGVEEMVVWADGGTAGGSHSVTWFIFNAKGDEWAQAMRRDQSVPDLKVANGVVKETTGVYRPGDALCCPSSERTGEVRFKDGKFRYFPERRLPKDLEITIDPKSNEVAKVGPFDAFSASGTDFRRVFGESSSLQGASNESCVNSWKDWN